MSCEVHVRFCEGVGVKFPSATHLVACFQRREDVRVFMVTMHERLGKFHLEIAEEKTRQIVFGRFAAERLAEKDQKPSEFDFLGFRHICGIDRAGKFALVRLPVQRSITRFLEDTKKWLWEHMHWKVRDQRRKLSEKLQGFYGYYALPHCGRKLYAVYGEVLKQWRGVLRRRSQRSQTHWSYLRSQNWFTLPSPRSLHVDV